MSIAIVFPPFIRQITSISDVVICCLLFACYLLVVVADDNLSLLRMQVIRVLAALSSHLLCEYLKAPTDCHCQRDVDREGCEVSDVTEGRD